VPTVRPRHTITETDEIAAAIDAMLRAQPELTRADALRELAVRAARGEAIESIDERRRRITALAGSLTGVYPPGYLASLREDWPE